MSGDDDPEITSKFDPNAEADSCRLPHLPAEKASKKSPKRNSLSPESDALTPDTVLRAAISRHGEPQSNCPVYLAVGRTISGTVPVCGCRHTPGNQSGKQNHNPNVIPTM